MSNCRLNWGAGTPRPAEAIIEAMPDRFSTSCSERKLLFGCAPIEFEYASDEVLRAAHDGKRGD